MGMFETLLEVDNQLVDWLIHASPRNDAEREMMRRIFALRGDLDDALNQLVGDRLKLAVADLPAETARLDAVAAELKTVSKTIDGVERVLTIAGTAAEVAAKAVGFALG
jgi:hypothetical protein